MWILDGHQTLLGQESQRRLHHTVCKGKGYHAKNIQGKALAGYLVHILHNKAEICKNM